MIIKINTTSVGKEIRNIRFNANDKAIDTCRKMYVSQTELSLIENGKARPSLQFIDKFAEIYNLSESEKRNLKIIAYSDLLGNIFDIPQEQVYYYFQNKVKKIS